MRIKYEFASGEVTEVEVPKEIGEVIIEENRREESANRKEHRHCYSMDAATYEGNDYAIPDFTEDSFSESSERNTRVRHALSTLSDIQKARILLLAEGLSIREIARREGKDFSTVRESIEAARKKFLKNF